MGYDKGDIAFVIHFRMPANIVSYYQQIGRAGRSIPRAYTFLMCGEKDAQILNSFRNTPFPREAETNAIMELIRSSDGIRLGRLAARVNIRQSGLRKALSFLLHDGYIRKEQSTYCATAYTMRNITRDSADFRSGRSGGRWRKRCAGDFPAYEEKRNEKCDG